MKIDRSNYEIWLIECLDCTLNNSQVEDIRQFLYENPDLREEFYNLASVNLSPYEIPFPNKDLLFKTTRDLSLSQFEYLSVASLEDDLSAEQKAELNEVIDNNPEKKIAFDLIQKTKLSPVNITFRHKNRLIRRTPAQKVIQLTVIVLSAAAAIALMIVTFSIFPRNLSDKTYTTVQNIAADSSLRQLPENKETGKIMTDKKPDLSNKKRGNVFAGVLKNTTVTPQSDLQAIKQNDSLIQNIENRELSLKKIYFNAEIDLNVKKVKNTLVASKLSYITPSYDDERSNVSKFVTRTFRVNILKETTSNDNPLKAYEIAEAGVTGLNNLLGWEMTLNENKDENGELRSVYFSSKILKFNAPVKKTESSP